MARKLTDSDGHRRHDRQMLNRGATLGFRLVEPPEAECYFCDRTSVKDSLEHIVPQWLHDVLDLRDKTFEPVYTSRGLNVHGRGSIPADSLVASGICVDCNTGWMSRIESRYAPVFRGEVPMDSQALAMWFVKTAFVLNVTQNTRLLVPREIRLALAAGSVSERVSVFLHQTEPPEDVRFNWVQNPIVAPMVYPAVNTDAVSESLKHLWACSINLDGLIATVVVNPPGDFYASSWERLGKLLVNRGRVKPTVNLDSLPRLQFWGTACCLVPSNVTWGGRGEVTMDFPEMRSFSDMSAYNVAVSRYSDRNPAAQHSEGDSFRQ